MTRNHESTAYNDNNVYILGAGFSFEAGLPLIKDFMNRMRDAAAWLEEEQEGRKAEIEAIERVLDFRLRAAAAAYRVPLNVENIEDLFSLAAASGEGRLSDHMTTAIAATLDYASRKAVPARRITVSKLDDSDWNKPANWQILKQPEQGSAVTAKYPLAITCPPYEFYLGLLCAYFNGGGIGRDTIISLNYDTVVEDALWAIGLPFRYGAEELIEWRPSRPTAGLEREPIPVLKLHGTVNLTPPVKLDTGPKLLAYRSYEELRNEGHTPMLVAPTWQKSLDGYLSEVWKKAVLALRLATRVIILGYSMPKTDQHFRYLLAAGFQENISLRKVFFVNRDASGEIEQRLCSVFRSEHIEQGIIERVPPQDVRNFLLTEASPTGSKLGRALNQVSWRYSP